MPHPQKKIHTSLSIKSEISEKLMSSDFYISEAQIEAYNPLVQLVIRYWCIPISEHPVIALLLIIACVALISAALCYAMGAHIRATEERVRQLRGRH